MSKNGVRKARKQEQNSFPEAIIALEMIDEVSW